MSIGTNIKVGIIIIYNIKRIQRIFNFTKSAFEWVCLYILSGNYVHTYILWHKRTDKYKHKLLNTPHFDSIKVAKWIKYNSSI